MFFRLVRFLVTGLLGALVIAGFVLLGAAISAAAWLGPPFFRLCAALTGWTLERVDQLLRGLLTRRAAVAYLLAGALWVLVGAAVLLLLNLTWSLRSGPVAMPALLGGLFFGLACGHRAQQRPHWGSWRGEEEGLQVGEMIG